MNDKQTDRQTKFYYSVFLDGQTTKKHIANQINFRSVH